MKNLAGKSDHDAEYPTERTGGTLTEISVSFHAAERLSQKKSVCASEESRQPGSDAEEWEFAPWRATPPIAIDPGLVYKQFV